MIQKRTTGTGETRYLVRLPRGVDPQTGKKLHVFKTFATKKEAQRWATAQQRALDTGTFIEPSQVSLATYLHGWLDGPAKLKLRERTWQENRRMLRRYVLASDLGLVPLARLTTLALERVYADLAAREPHPLSPYSIRLLHGVLHGALAKAVKDRMIPVNPATGATLPRMPRREMRALDADQLRRLLATSDATGNRFHALWHLLAHSGLRPSEALGLTWADVGSDRVHIRRVLVMGIVGTGWTLTDPKTRGSRRTVTLPGATMEALAWHRTKQEAEKLAAGGRYHDHGFVFASQTGTPLCLANLVTRYFKPLLTAYYPLPAMRLYDLRHTHASILLAAGVPVNVVSQRLGHASAKMTLDIYAHVLSGQQEDAVARLESYMAGSAGR